MDPVHDRGSMDPVHESGPWTGSKVGVHGPGVHVLSSPMQMSMLLNYPWSTLLVWTTSWKVFWTRWTIYANAQHQVVMVSNVIQTLKLNFLLSDKYLCCIGMKKLYGIELFLLLFLFFITSYTTVCISACTANPINFYFDIGYTLCVLLLNKFLMFPRATFLPYISVDVFCFVFCLFRYPST